ncbi:Hypothetical predicted protein, partial [Mytilus galloprovincialis]
VELCSEFGVDTVSIVIKEVFRVLTEQPFKCKVFLSLQNKTIRQSEADVIGKR